MSFLRHFLLQLSAITVCNNKNEKESPTIIVINDLIPANGLLQINDLTLAVVLSRFPLYRVASF
ncbi:MAG: hypothetical protein ACJAZA_001252 [Shewanella psychromarinicola]|jgi:hypothetical protein